MVIVKKNRALRARKRRGILKKIPRFARGILKNPNLKSRGAPTTLNVLSVSHALMWETPEIKWDIMKTRNRSAELGGTSGDHCGVI